MNKELAPLWMSRTNVVFRNTIFSGNTGTVVDDLWLTGVAVSADGSNCFHNSCCPTFSLPLAQGNVQADPRFVDAAGGNFRLRGSSPCVNAGTNQAWMSNWLDLDGNPRLDTFSGVVDMGCYEHIRVGALFLVR